MTARRIHKLLFQSTIIVLCAAISPTKVQAQGPVPGTGAVLTEIGDDFEDPQWSYVMNSPKSSKDLDGKLRQPMGVSRNGRWYEGSDRGHPDIIRRVETPEGGLPGSTGALLLMTRDSGVPGHRERKSQQDNVFMHVGQPYGGGVPVSSSPSIVVRLHIPPFETLERRQGSVFALRATLRGNKGSGATEPYWPGMFIAFNPGRGPDGKDTAFFQIRSNERGQDYRGPQITSTGWWTLGMSFSPDGRVHYYAHQGVEDLTASDHIASHACYGFRAKVLRSAFFDLFTTNDGQTTTAEWIIDDPTVYVASRPPQPVARRNRR